MKLYYCPHALFWSVISWAKVCLASKSTLCIILDFLSPGGKNSYFFSLKGSKGNNSFKIFEGCIGGFVKPEVRLEFQPHDLNVKKVNRVSQGFPVRFRSRLLRGGNFCSLHTKFLLWKQWFVLNSLLQQMTIVIMKYALTFGNQFYHTKSNLMVLCCAEGSQSSKLVSFSPSPRS